MSAIIEDRRIEAIRQAEEIFDRVTGHRLFLSPRRVARRHLEIELSFEAAAILGTSIRARNSSADAVVESLADRFETIARELRDAIK